MAKKSDMETIWHISDEMWSVISEILGPEKKAGTVGRPAVSFRIIFDAIIYVLRTGCQWQAIPRSEYAPGSTVHGRFQQWVKSGVFQEVWEVMLYNYDELEPIRKLIKSRNNNTKNNKSRREMN